MYLIHIITVLLYVSPRKIRAEKKQMIHLGKAELLTFSNESKERA